MPKVIKLVKDLNISERRPVTSLNQVVKLQDTKRLCSPSLSSNSKFRMPKRRDNLVCATDK